MEFNSRRRLLSSLLATLTLLAKQIVDWSAIFVTCCRVSGRYFIYGNCHSTTHNLLTTSSRKIETKMYFGTLEIPYMKYLLGGCRRLLLAQISQACCKMAANLLEKRVGSKLLFIRHATRLVRRKLCAVAVQEEKGHQTGIPLIIAPHVIRRAFIVHPSTKEINASLKYQWFTKTKLYEGLPSSLSDVDRYFSVEEYEVVKEPFRNSVLQNYGFRKEATNDRKNERSQELLKLGVMQDLLRFGWSFADRYRHLNDCFLDFEPKIKIHWVRHHNFYQLEHKRPKPAYIIRAKEPTSLFEPGMIVHCTSLSITIIVFMPIPLKTISNTLKFILFLTFFSSSLETTGCFAYA